MLWVSIEHSAKSFYKQRNIILYIYIYIYMFWFAMLVNEYKPEFYVTKLEICKIWAMFISAGPRVL